MKRVVAPALMDTKDLNSLRCKIFHLLGMKDYKVLK